MGTTLYQQIAQTLDARQRCLTNTTTVMDGERDVTRDHWADMVRMHEETLNRLADALPSGSGWDQGTAIDWTASRPEKLVLHGSYHHMNDGGMYDGWTDHTITVRPSLRFGITVTVSGRNRNDIKEYLHEAFFIALTADVAVAS